MRRVITPIVIVSLVLLTFFVLDLSRIDADDSDIFGRNVQPNVLILIDSSGSMDEEVPNAPYIPATTYATQNRCRVGGVNNQPCTSTVVYQYSSGRLTPYATTIASVGSSSARSALSTTGYWSGRISGSNVQLYAGNYLNYVYAPDFVMERKIDIAKRVITNLISNTEGVRFGAMKFNSSSNGASMVAQIGTATSTMVSAINAMSVAGWTPTGEQIRDAGNYFKGTFGSYASPIQADCQPNFIIVVSDGDWNGSVNPETEATNRFTQDHATGTGFPGTQNVLVHTVGFGAGLSQDGLDALEDTAINGGGSFYTAQDSTALELALQEAIRQIVAATFTFASPVIPTTSTTGSSKIYTAAFRTDAVRPMWRGFLKAYQRASDGEVPVDDDGVPLDSALVWEAGQELSEKAASARTIYTVVSGSRTDFTKTNAAITNSLLAAASTTEKDKIIDFTRGLDSYDEDVDGNTTEERAWKLGDIFHSNPVLVSPPFLPLTDSSYQTFKTNNASRTTILLAGANDGMVHAFRESDGEELWALIPPDALPRLKNLTARSGEHDFYVDSSPIVADIIVSGNWKTIAVFGQRRGGRNYYALDVTNTTNPSYLWTFTDSRIGETWSEPAIGKIKMNDGTTKYVAFIGGGYDTGENNETGKIFYVIDLATGAKLWEYYNNSSSNDRQYMNFSFAVSPAAADLNGDGFVDRVYIGDVGGQVWKFDLSAPATLSSGLVNNWTGKRLFAAASTQANPPAVGEYYPTQAIYATPTLSYDTAGDLWVFFGTGDRNHPNNSSSNRFYGIKDNTSMTNGSTLTESSLVNVSTTYATASQGWYFVLESTEKVLASATVFNKIVFFSTFTPSTTTSCAGGGGEARLCGVAMQTGYAGVDWSTGNAVSATTGSTGSSLNSAHSARSTVVGTGIASKPIVVVNQNGATVSSAVIAATTDQQLLSNPAPPPALKRILYWREVF
jgi:type IV pilus assembly protein PilY1